VIETRLEIAGEGRCSLGLDRRDARQAVDQANLVCLGERLAKGGGVAEVAAGQGDDVRRLPVEIREDLEDDGLLALRTKRVDRVGEVDVELARQLSQEFQGEIEIAGDLYDGGAVGDGLAELASRDLAVRDED